MAIAAFLLLAWQALIVQTHVHLAVARTSQTTRSIAQAPASDARQRPPADSSSDCPLCRALAEGGHFLTPTAIGFAAVAASIAPPAGGSIPIRAGARPLRAQPIRGPPAASPNP